MPAECSQEKNESEASRIDLLFQRFGIDPGSLASLVYVKLFSIHLQKPDICGAFSYQVVAMSS
jgi:hypothetical protein